MYRMYAKYAFGIHRSGAVGGASECQSKGPGFEPCEARSVYGALVHSAPSMCVCMNTYDYEYSLRNNCSVAEW